jgi:Tol biopolymer transport system component
LDRLHFCLVSADGSQLEVLSERHLGSGHPSIDPSGRFLLTDAYPKETWVVDASGEVPIRLLDLEVDEEVRLCTVPVALGAPRTARRKRNPVWRRLLGLARARSDTRGGSHYKLDPHPAWDRDSRRICFNGVSQGQRQVFVADVSGQTYQTHTLRD